MQIPQEKIDELQRKTNIRDFNSVTKEEFQNIQKMVAEKSLDKNELALLVELMPNFIELQKDFIDGLKTVAEKAGASQKSAFDIIHQQITMLESLTKSIQTDEARIKIAEILERIVEKTNVIIKEMNTNNNDFWKYLGVGMATVVAVIGTFLVSKKE